MEHPIILGNDLATELRRRRVERGLTVADTSRRAGITRAYLYRLETQTGHARPSFDVLARLASALGASSVDELTGREARIVVSDLPPGSLRQYAEGTLVDSKSLAALSALVPFANPAASPAEWALVHEILAHTILADEVQRRRETAGPNDGIANGRVLLEDGGL